MLKWLYLVMLVFDMVMAFVFDFIVKDKAKAAYFIAWGAFFLTLYHHEP